MNINFNVTGSERKRLVSIITHATGEKGTYEGVPTMAYRIGGFTVDKTGGLSWDDTVENGTLLKVYEEIKAAGFEPEEEPDLRNTPEVTQTAEENTEAAEEEGLGGTPCPSRKRYRLTWPLSQPFVRWRSRPSG